MGTFSYLTLRRHLFEPPSPAEVASVVRATPFGTATTAVNVLIFTAARWNSLGGIELAVWCAATLALCVIVFRKSLLARNVTVARVSRRAARRLSFTSFLLSLPWGVLAAVVLPTGDEFDRIVTLILCVGMYTGAAIMLHRTLAAAFTYVLTVNLGVVAGCVMLGLSDAWVLILYDFISAAFVFSFAFLAGETARERDNMLARLSQANRELEAANRKISSFAYVDSLTGLPSRKAFSEAIERDLAEAQQNGRRYAVLMFDLDNFKNVNDSLGHQAGDELLSRTGERISNVLDEDSIVARIGGDEFAVLSPLDAMQAPDELAEKLIDTVTQPVELGGRLVVPATSLGIAILPDHADSASELLIDADAAMRRAKELGKGRTVTFDEQLGQELRNANMVADELKKALEDGGLSVHYQPKFDLNSGKMCCVEALLRWFHPSLGRLSPDYFLPIAVERATMQQLSAFLFRQVAQDVLAWRKAGIRIGRVAINIHPVDLKAPEHLMKMIGSLAAQGVGPDDISLEITEGCYVGRGTEAAPTILGEISAKGYELSLDDFGTGHAALTHLQNLPVSEIKIDKSFVASITESRSARAIVSAMIAIAKGMGLRSVAEGVETTEQLEVLRDLGAQYGQGYLWSPALPAEELAAFACGQEIDRSPDVREADGFIDLETYRLPVPGTS